ncbi:MAG: hypothetical protein MI747_09610 [Desulfobacterales bacterium]|nr:hypothetical protein [Desulfobacterales bacterium]
MDIQQEHTSAQSQKPPKLSMKKDHLNVGEMAFHSSAPKKADDWGIMALGQKKAAEKHLGQLLEKPAKRCSNSNNRVE